jgi:predicted metalloprotease with PDZ domain
MAEGFTEYYANVTLAREGLIPADLFLKKAERHLGNYLYFMTAPAFTRMSLVEAGRNTGVNRFGVYDGGWAVAFCLDGLIRERSGDRASLDDFVRALWQRARAGGPGYSVPDLDALADRLAGGPLGEFVARHVEGSEVVPPRRCLERVGLTGAFKGYAAEAYLFPDANASRAASSRGRALYGAR